MNSFGLSFIFIFSIIYAEFRFCHISDTHARGGTLDNWMIAMSDDIKALTPKPKFVVVTGDITEFGAKTEFDSYISKIVTPLNAEGITVYSCIGNHDIAWAPLEFYIEKLGSPNWYFDYAGIRFIGFNPMPVGTVSSCFITDALVNWLNTVISPLDSTTPIFVFQHFQIDDSYYANYHKIWETLRKRNVKINFHGHGHAYGRTTVDNILSVKAEGAVDEAKGTAFEGHYTIVDVSTNKKEITFYKKRIGYAPVFWFTYDYSTPLNAPEIFVTAPMENSIIITPTFNISVVSSIDTVTSGSYSIDDGASVALTGSGKNWSATATTPALNGKHSLKISLTYADGRTWTKTIYFYSHVNDSYPKSLWRVFHTHPIVSSPFPYYGMVYVGCYDGKFYAYDARTGTLKWSFTVPGNKAVHSSPWVDDGAVYFGAGDWKLYALDAITGEKKWEYTTGGAIIGGPITDANNVYFGSCDCKMYAVDKKTGKFKWSYSTGDVIFINRPLLYNNKLYFGSWDRYMYALNLDGTLFWRRIPDGVTIKNYAPAVCQPYGVDNKIVFVTRTYSGGTGGDIHILDANTGATILRDTTARAYDSLGGFGNNFYIRTKDNTLVKYDMALNKVWTSPPDFTFDTSRSAPVYKDGKIYTASYGGVVGVYRDIDGAREWRYQLTTGINPKRGWTFATVGVQDGIVYCSGVDGVLTAIVNAPPPSQASIDIVHSSVSSVNVGEPINISATINVSTTVQLAKLYYRTSNMTNFITTTFTNITGNHFSASIPAQSVPTVIYYFIAVACYNAYKTLPADISSPYRINVIQPTTQDTTPPPVPTLISPLDGSRITDTRPTFDWNDVSDPSGVKYTLQVDNNSDFSSPEINISDLTTSEYTVTTDLIVNTTYYWRVRAVDGAGNQSDFSAIWSLVIIPLPQPITPPSPENYKPKERILTLDGDGQNERINFNRIHERGIAVKIYNLKGKLVKELIGVDNWDGKDSENNEVESGTYIYQYTIDGKVFSGRIVVIK